MKRIYKVFLLILFIGIMLGAGLLYARYQENNNENQVEEVVSTGPNLPDPQKYYPLYPKGREKDISQNNALDQEVPGFRYSYLVDDLASSVNIWYQTELPEQGWNIEKSESYESVSFEYQATKDNDTVRILIEQINLDDDRSLTRVSFFKPGEIEN
jgi:hypothetical protein